MKKTRGLNKKTEDKQYMNIIGISKAATMAIAALVELSRSPSALSNRILAKRLYFREMSLSKVLQRLKGAGLLVSIRGPHGGYILRSPSCNTTVAAVVQAIDGPFEPGSIVGSGRHGQMMLRLEESAREILRDYTIEFLAGV